MGQDDTRPDTGDGSDDRKMTTVDIEMTVEEMDGMHGGAKLSRLTLNEYLLMLAMRNLSGWPVDDPEWPGDADTRLRLVKGIDHGPEDELEHDFNVQPVLVARDGEFCCYCGEIPAVPDMDHVVPRTPRPGEPAGRHVLANLVRACKPCNKSKHNWPLGEWIDHRGGEAPNGLPITERAKAMAAAGPPAGAIAAAGAKPSDQRPQPRRSPKPGPQQRDKKVTVFEMPADLQEALYRTAAIEHRSASAHLRYLVETDERRRAAGLPTDPSFQMAADAHRYRLAAAAAAAIDEANRIIYLPGTTEATEAAARQIIRLLQGAQGPLPLV